MKPTRQIPVDRLREAFSYDPETGAITLRADRSGSPRSAGETALSAHGDGYSLVYVGGRSFYAHRIAWALGHGAWPVGYIDHVNGDRADNRLANLRETTKRGNAENMRHAYKNNRTGMLGVNHRPDYKGLKKYRARIRVDGRLIHLGDYYTAEDAHGAYLEAKRRMHAGCTL